MSNKLLIKAEYVVSHPLAGTLHVMDIFKPHKKMHERLIHAKANGEFYFIQIIDASGDHISRTSQRIISVSLSEYHNTLVVTTSDI